MDFQEHGPKLQWLKKVLLWAVIFILIVLFYFASPIGLFAAFRFGLLDPDAERLIAILAGFYYPAEWLTDHFEPYNRYIGWSMRVTDYPD